MTLVLRLLLAGLWLCGSLASEPSSAKVEVFDLDGNSVDPLSKCDGNALVFVFVSVDCPISNSYSPELKRLREEFGAKGVVFRLVYPIADQTVEQIREHLKSYALPFEAWRDPKHSLVALAQARVTPEAAVFVPAKGWVYRGRIDDRNVDFGKKRAAATQRDLREALQAIVEGKELKPAVTRAVGCYISSTP